MLVGTIGALLVNQKGRRTEYWYWCRRTLKGMAVLGSNSGNAALSTCEECKGNHGSEKRTNPVPLEQNLPP